MRINKSTIGPCAIFLLCLLAGPGHSSAQLPELRPPATDWQGVRDQQIPEITLKMELPKQRYYLGEPIMAKLTFTNYSQAPFEISTANYDRIGRLPDITFVALGTDGKPAPDPVEWYFKVGSMGGLRSHVALGEWSIELAANQWFAFPGPGTYQLYAYSTRAGGRTAHIDGKPMVSDMIEIVIDPLEPAKEAAVIEEMKLRLDAKDIKTAREAAETLRYLNTDAARAALLPALGNEQINFPAMMAFFAAPDPQAMAQAIFDAVKEGRLVMTQSVQSTYQRLRTKGQPRTSAESDAEWLARWKAPADELAKAATAATGGKGPEYVRVLLTKAYGDPVKRKELARELARHQDEFEDHQVQEILGSWDSFGNEDFLPMVRREAAPPKFNGYALQALASLRLEEARALVIAELGQGQWRYKGGRGINNNRALTCLAPEPIPELQAKFKEILTDPDTVKGNRKGIELDILLAAINRYGSAEILPDVAALYLSKEGLWACAIQSNALKFWVRHDPAEGLKVLENALTFREKTGCYRDVLAEVLGAYPHDEAPPPPPAAETLAQRSLADPQPEVAIAAIRVLTAHFPSPENLTRCLETVEKIKLQQKDRERHASSAAGWILEGKRWTLTEPQTARLREIQKANF